MGLDLERRTQEGAEYLEMTEVNQEAPGGVPPMGGTAKVDNPEVVAVAKRRRFSDAYKRRILEETDRAGPGEIGLILRREGLYSSQLAQWRRRRDMSGKKTKKTAASSLETQNKRLQKENAKLTLKLRKAEAMLELQKKTSSLISLMTESNENGSNSNS